jgi:hypothetical protein
VCVVTIPHRRWFGPTGLGHLKCVFPMIGKLTDRKRGAYFGQMFEAQFANFETPGKPERLLEFIDDTCGNLGAVLVGAEEPCANDVCL